MASTETKIMDYVTKNSGCVSTSMIGADLQLKDATLARVLAKLAKSGRIQRAWDGSAWEISDTERRDRAEIAEFARHLATFRL